MPAPRAAAVEIYFSGEPDAEPLSLPADLMAARFPLLTAKNSFERRAAASAEKGAAASSSAAVSSAAKASPCATASSAAGATRLDLWKLGLTRDHFLLALSRVSEKPILSGKEEYEIRRKLGICTLDEVDLNCPPGCFDEKLAALPKVLGGGAVGSGDALGAEDGVDPPRKRAREEISEEDGETDNTAKVLQDRNIYELLGLFGVETDPVFREVFFERNVNRLLVAPDESSPDELIDLHLPDGKPRIREGARTMLEFPKDVIVVPPPDGFRTQSTKGISDAIKTMPIHLRKLLTVDIPGLRFSVPGMRWVLAGGAVFNMVTGNSDEFAKAKGCDYDFFLILPHIQNLPAEEQEAAVHHCMVEALTAVEETVVAYCKVGEWKTSPVTTYCGLGISGIQRSSHAITMYLEGKEKTGRREAETVPRLEALQFVGYYSSVADVIKTFDIGSCQVVFDGRFRATRKGIISLATQSNTASLHDLSPQYIHRMGKYFSRRLSVALPVHFRFPSIGAVASVLEDPILRNLASKDTLSQELRCRFSVKVKETASVFEVEPGSRLFDSYSSYMTLGGDDCPIFTQLPKEAQRILLDFKNELDLEARKRRQALYQEHIETTSVLERLLVSLLRCPGSAHFGRPAEKWLENQAYSEDVADVFPKELAESRRAFPSFPGTGTLDRFVDDGGLGLYTQSCRQRGSEERLLSRSVEEGTSGGIRLLWPPVDKSFSEHCEVLKARNQKRKTIASRTLMHVLNPHQCRTATNVKQHEPVQPHQAAIDPSDFVSIGIPEDAVSVTIPIPADWSNVRKTFPSGELPVPPELAKPFKMLPRDGKGSFEKKDPAIVLKDDQWFIKNYGEAETVRWFVGV